MCEQKIQDPRSKIQGSAKIQVPTAPVVARFGAWSLELLWILALGSWILISFSLIRRKINGADGDTLAEEVDLGNMVRQVALLRDRIVGADGFESLQDVRL